MTLRRLLPPLLLLAALAPVGASAGVHLVPREEPLGAARAKLARPAPLAFNMVGIHWRGPGEVWFRTAAEPGRWSAWQPARPEEEDLPDAGSAEARRAAGWKLGNPYWTGSAHWIQYRVTGRVTGLRTFFIESPVRAVSKSAAVTAARPAQPAIIRRSQWGANESIVRDTPSYAERVRFSVVHHTAGTNSYSAAQSAAIVRGIQRYHVLANGWDDIGYNFLVDKHGQIFEGRGGGIAENVIGAHAQGFNTGSVGVAVLGTYEGARVPAAGRAALQRLLAWRLDVAHVDPLARYTHTSYGNPRFPAGTRVRLRTVSGHRNTGYTSCPGTALYGQLGAVARTVAGMGLPKLYDPEVAGGLGGLVRFTARLSSARAWLVTVRNGQGAVVAQGNGSGTQVDWTWNSSSAPVDRYTYSVEAGASVRPATGQVPGPPPLAVTRLHASPPVLTPNGDGWGERTQISFSLSRRATARAEVLSGNVVVKTLLAGANLPGGVTRLPWDGRAEDGTFVTDQRYRIRVTATAEAEEVVKYAGIVVDRTLGSLTVAPARFSPNRDGRLETASIGFELVRPAHVRVRVQKSGRTIATLLSRSLAGGTQAVTWNGSSRGARVPDGVYSAVVDATTTLGTRRLTRSITVDTTPPRVRVLSLRLVDGGTRLRFRLTEAASLRIQYGRRTWVGGSSVSVERAAGWRQVILRAVAGAVRIVARDEAGNASRPAVFTR